MKTMLLLSLIVCLHGGERERGLALYKEGRFAEAAAAFQKALTEDGDSAELQWNLALAAWRAGDLATAETAAEKYAALDRGVRVDLHAGLLGAVRHDEAQALEGQADALAQAPAVPPDPAGAPPAAPADPLPLLEQALAKATQARDHFVRGATAKPTPELLRNTERALRTIAELQKKIDELKKQREQQQKDDKQDKNDEKQDDEKDESKKDESKQGDKKDEPKPDEKTSDDKKSDEGKSEQSKSAPQQPGEGEERPEPKPQPGPDQKDRQGKDQQPAEQAPEPKPGQKRQDAPGEQAEGKQLTPEQAQRLLEQLRELDEKQKQIRARAKTGRRPVERDW